VRKIVSFSEDLSSNENVDFARLDSLAHARPRILVTRRVTIDAQYPSRWKQLRQSALDTLRTLTNGRQSRIPALGTRLRDARTVAAVMTMKRSVRKVQHKLR
jgi:hypothetical protein